ncbi:MAG: sensor domain-containing diguanylate cyclase [Acidobacteriota bacterium]|nr:sensor domain-containing diguanylate cyclase [Acidobacteriota bacterium]
MTIDEQLGPARPFRDFEEAASVVLRLLQENVGLGLWMVTRKEGDDWIVLTAQDRIYGVQAGQVLRWSDSFCSRMVRGLGPRIAPIASQIAAYAEAPIGRQMEIGAYVGVPLRRSDGTLFGTLCAVDPRPQPESIETQLESVEVHARLLATILSAEMEQQARLRQLERAEARSKTDPLTGLYNRGAWEETLEIEEKRCRRYGSPAGVLLIDLDGLKQVNDAEGHAAGDRLLKRAALVLREAVRESDFVARIGGDEFAVLAPDESALTLERLEERLRRSFEGASIAASLGGARRDPRQSLAAAVEQADRVLYADKRQER